MSLELDDWIHAQTFSLGSYQSDRRLLDSKATGKLLLRLAAADRRPNAESEIEGFLDTVREWCRAIVEGSEWDNFYSIWQWSSIWDSDVIANTIYQIFREFLELWVENELQSVLENARDSEDCYSWADEVESMIRRYFGLNPFRKEFDWFEEKAVEKFNSDYRPSSEDFANYGNYRSIGEAVEERESMESSRVDRSTRSEGFTKEIDALFSQLE